MGQRLIRRQYHSNTHITSSVSKARREAATVAKPFAPGIEWYDH